MTRFTCTKCGLKWMNKAHPYCPKCGWANIHDEPIPDPKDDGMTCGESFHIFGEQPESPCQCGKFHDRAEASEYYRNKAQALKET